MNTYTIFLKSGGATTVPGWSYQIDKDKGYLYILNDKKWRVGIFFLEDVAGFTVDFFGKDSNGEGNYEEADL